LFILTSITHERERGARRLAENVARSGIVFRTSSLPRGLVRGSSVQSCHEGGRRGGRKSMRTRVLCVWAVPSRDAATAAAAAAAAVQIVFVWARGCAGAWGAWGQRLQGFCWGPSRRHDRFRCALSLPEAPRIVFALARLDTLASCAMEASHPRRSSLARVMTRPPMRNAK